MNGELNINWTEVENALANLDEYRQQILIDMTKFSQLMKENTQGLVGEKADDLRKQIVKNIGSGEFENMETLKAIYKNINDLNYELKIHLQQLAIDSDHVLNINMVTFDYDISNAWNFEWKSNSTDLKLFNKNQLRDNLNSISIIIDDIEWIVASYLGTLKRLIYDEVFSSNIDDSILSKGQKFVSIIGKIKAQISRAIIDIDIYIDDLEKITNKFGQSISDI